MRVCVLAIVSLVLVGACARGSSSETESSTSDLVSSSSSALADGLTMINSTPSLLAIEDSSEDNPYNPQAACSTVSFTACASGVRTRSFGTSGCEVSSSLTRFGTVTLTFSDTTNCLMSTTNNTVTRTLSNHYLSLSSGIKVLTYTATGTVGDTTISASDLQDFNGTTRQGGQVLTKTATANQYTLAINGVHRKGVRASGATIFWHTVYTATGSPLTVTQTSDTYTIASGTQYIALNRLSTLTTMTYSNVSVTPATCCYPTAGSMTVQLGSATASTVTFSSTCGSATVDGTAVTLPTCGSSSGT